MKDALCLSKEVKLWFKINGLGQSPILQHFLVLKSFQTGVYGMCSLPVGVSQCPGIFTVVLGGLLGPCALTLLCYNVPWSFSLTLRCLRIIVQHPNTLTSQVCCKIRGREMTGSGSANLEPPQWIRHRQASLINHSTLPMGPQQAFWTLSQKAPGAVTALWLCLGYEQILFAIPGLVNWLHSRESSGPWNPVALGAEPFLSVPAACLSFSIPAVARFTSVLFPHNLPFWRLLLNKG